MTIWSYCKQMKMDITSYMYRMKVVLEIGIIIISSRRNFYDSIN